MNFYDYAKHIIQKYRLAVAIAIVKNTPENCAVQSYFEKLKTNVSSQMETYDDDITICEDDFDFDDENNDSTNNDEQEQAINDQNLMNRTNDDSLLNDSATILKDFDFDEMIRNLNKDNHRDDNESISVQEAIRILKGSDSEYIIREKVSSGKHDVSNNLNSTQSTYYDSSQSLIPATNVSLNKSNSNQNTSRNEISNPESDKPDISKCIKHNEVDGEEKCSKTNINTQQNPILHDSQKTALNDLQELTDNFTHVSQSQVNNIVLPRYLLDKTKHKDSLQISVDTTFRTATDEQGSNRTKNISTNTNNYNQTETDYIKSSQDNNFELKRIVEFGNLRKHTESLEEICVLNGSNTSVANISNQINDNKRTHYDIDKSIEKFEAKRLKHEDNNSNSCFSLAHYNGMKNLFNTNESQNSLDFNFSGSNTSISESTQSILNKLITDRIYDCNDRYNVDANTLRNEMEFDRNYNLNESRSEDTINLNIRGQTIKINNNGSFLRFSQELDSEDVNTPIRKAAMDEMNSKNDKEYQNIIHQAANENAEVDIEDTSDTLTDVETELVPFKVVEELNKIKAYLNKRDKRNGFDCVSDSGYKTDSQSKTSYKNALHLSTAWLNQSAHTLMSFIVSCTLVVNTADITNEISRTLGQLIDKLHEEERYPSFLEEHLAEVENLLKEVFEGAENDELMKKDETVHRIFLLNKSSHIIKYTVEKILAVLEDVHSKLTQDDLYELSYIDQFENLPYIFHILETLIKKIIVYNKLSSQTSTQNSQDEEGILKKSSITDIWRKKWNLSKKTEVDTNISSTKQCVLVNCSVLLNKIIVQAMDGYSLISFYALQCFNLLQN